MGNELEDQGQALAPAAGADAAGAQGSDAGSGGAQQTALPRPSTDGPASVDGGGSSAAQPQQPAQDGQLSAPVQSTTSGQPASSGADDGRTATASPNADSNADAGKDASADAGQSGDAPSPPSSLECRFCGLDGEPIVGAQYRFAVDGQDVSGTTDGNGCAQTLQNLTPNANCTVSIKRDDGTYKQVASFAVPATDGYVTLMSPSALLESQSELHGGNPDDAYKESPPADGGASGAGASSSSADGKGGDADTPAAADANAGNASTGAANAAGANTSSASPANANTTTQQDSASQSASSAQPPPAKNSPTSSTPAAPKQASASGQAHPPAKPSGASTAHNGGTGKTPQPKTVEHKRDALGHPQAKPAESATDWVDRKVMGAWHYVEDLFGLKTNPVMAAILGAKPATGAKPASPQTGAPADAASEAAQGAARAATLIQIAEEQSLHRMSSKHTADNISALSKGTFKYAGDKGAAESLHQCYMFVKVALWRAKYVPGALGGTFAKVAGPFLEQAGFKNVTGELPDARWAWPGDVIVYAVHGDPSPDTDNVGLEGHIDIRSYHHYISDFRRNHLFFHGAAHRSYDVVGIYRKPGFSDPSVTARIKAFLKVIRSRECSTLYDHFGDKYTYGAKYGALKPSDCITDFSKHPGSVDGHSPAGAYELTEPTWNNGWQEHGMPKDFSPATQDRYAVWRMDMRWENMNDQSSKTALGYVRLGDVDNAVKLLRPEWAALPGTSQSRGYTMEQLHADYNTFLKEFQS